MHPIDILFSTGMVLVFSVILFAGLILTTAASFGNPRAIELVNSAIISGRVQMICMLLLIGMARSFANNDMMVTAYATLYGGVVLCIVFTGFWMAARHVRFVQQQGIRVGRYSRQHQMHQPSTQ
jgi:hypothetical protein